VIAKMIEGANRICGKAQGYSGLPIRDEPVDLANAGRAERVNCMVTAWEPTPEELARLNAGAPVVVRILGYIPPPIALEVGTAPDEVDHVG
jgi:hypothetical protein